MKADRTVAAGEHLEFGTKVYISGKGIYEVTDRGGMISEGDIDIAVESRQEAFDWGRQEKKVIIIQEDKE